MLGPSSSGIPFGMKPKKRTADRHSKESKMVRIKAEFIGQLEELNTRRLTGVTQLVNEAVREKLEKEGLWPK